MKMPALDRDEQAVYDSLRARRGGPDESPWLAQTARGMVARDREAEHRIQTLRELAVSSLGVRQKLELWDLYRWAKENGVQFLGQLIANVFAQKGWQTSLVGVPILLLAGYVQFYCATDAATGGWIDPHCAQWVKYALWLSPLGSFLAPGFTAKVEKTP